MKNTYCAYLLFILMLVSCTSSDRLISTHVFSDGEWSRFTNPVLDFQIKNPGIYYDMFLELDVDLSQKPDNLKMTVIMNSPGGEIRSRDIVPDFNAASVDGKNARLRIVLRREYAFSEKGVCSFEIENRDSKTITTGVKSISIVLEKSQ